MAFIVPVMKKDYSIYSKKVAPVRSSPTTRCSFKGLEPIAKFEVGKMHERQRSEFPLAPSLPDTRHVHFGNCETISYFVFDEETLVGEDDDFEGSEEVDNTNRSNIPNYMPIQTVLRSALRRPYTVAAKSSARASGQSSLRTIWKMAILCSPKN
uniref:Uncharacterized protein n=1 Tax=Ascaris lumbricoides TaxID=6252 RepID=A0A0M3HMK3_ASCLU